MNLLLENMPDANDDDDDLDQLIQKEKSYNITQLRIILENNTPD